MNIRFAIIGCGRISKNHLEAIKCAPHAQLVAVCDVIEDKAKNAALDNGLNKWYTDIEDMLKNETIDVCCILTPSGMHSEHACIVANHGVNVLCEKPLDVTCEKMKKMIDCCRENNVKLGAVFQRRTYDGAILAKKAVESGELGKISIADASLKYYRNQQYYDGDAWRGTWELDGGGALMNQGIHGVDLLSWIMGGIESVYARCENIVWDIEVEDTAIVNVKFKNGAIGVIECTTAAYQGYDTILSFHGSKGSVSVGNSMFYHWNFENPLMQKPEITGSMGGLNCQYKIDSKCDHTHTIEDMALSVLEDRQPMITGEEAKKSVEIILAIYESARTGKEIKIN